MFDSQYPEDVEFEEFIAFRVNADLIDKRDLEDVKQEEPEYRCGMSKLDCEE